MEILDDFQVFRNAEFCYFGKFIVGKFQATQLKIAFSC